MEELMKKAEEINEIVRKLYESKVDVFVTCVDGQVTVEATKWGQKTGKNWSKTKRRVYVLSTYDGKWDANRAEAQNRYLDEIGLLLEA